MLGALLIDSSLSVRDTDIVAKKAVAELIFRSNARLCAHSSFGLSNGYLLWPSRQTHTRSSLVESGDPVLATRHSRADSAMICVALHVSTCNLQMSML